MNRFFKSVTIISCFLTMTLLNASQSDAEYDGIYQPIDKPKDFIASEFKKANAENKKVLFVLGGNWCHDSRSLAKKLDDASLAQTIHSNYRITMVDVGYLNQGFEFIEKTQMSTFYATPTVLIFDPVTGQHINSEDMHIWSNAAKVSQEDANSYFENYATKTRSEEISNLSKAQQKYLTKLQLFVAYQEGRIKQGYGIVGPMLEGYKSGNVDENFQAYWQELSDLRMNLPDDVKEIREKIMISTDKDLSHIAFPSYKLFSWESLPES